MSTVDQRRFRVVHPEGLARRSFVMSLERGAVPQETGSAAFAIDETLLATAHQRTDMGRITHWRLAAVGHSDLVVRDEELNLMQQECIVAC